MADNFGATPGSGITGAADDIGGVLHPRVKLIHGIDGVNDGDVALTNPLPAQLRDSDGTDVALSTKLGATNETAPATDTASSGLNGRLQRIAQRITSLIALVPAALTGSGNFKVSLQESNASQAVTVADGASVTFGAKADAKSTATDTTSVSAMSVWKQISASVQAAAASLAGTIAVSVASLPLPTGASTSANQSTGNTSLSNIDTNAGTTADAAATAGSTGTISAKLRAISRDLVSNIVLAAGANLIGDVGIQPRTSGGLTVYKLNSAASTNATSLKASAGQIYSVQVFNTNASARYLKFYNKASSPTVGTDTPVKVLTIPGNANGAGLVLSWPQGIAFGTGIAFAATTGAADSDTGAVAANEIIINIDYK